MKNNLPGSSLVNNNQNDNNSNKINGAETITATSSPIAQSLIHSSDIHLKSIDFITIKNQDKDDLMKQSKQRFPMDYHDPSSANLHVHDDEDLFVLMPFNHQVGGHFQMMLLNQNTLCKPLVPRELLFYMNIPPQLIEFVPKYKGVVEIRQNEGPNPTLYHPNKRLTQPTNTAADSFAEQQKPELRVRLSPCNDRGILESTNRNAGPLQQQQQQQQQQPIGYSSRPNQRYFMLLENIACKYHLPCVLDLKMGTRQHSEDASDEKRRRQMAKCAASTSAKLGLRICGMQVYHRISGTGNSYRVYSRDKYHGRRIKNEDGLKNELEIYFKNRTHLIKPIITRLKKLKAKIIETLRTTSFRFISTSLLIVSEGCYESHRARFDTKHTNSDGEDDYDYEDEEYFDSEDEDYDIEGKPIKPVVIHDEDSSSSLDSINSNHSEEKVQIIQDHLRQNESIPLKIVHCNRDHRNMRPTNEPEFDVRLIDFAHTSFNPTPSSSSSSDYGFILGIENLIRLLNEILFDKIPTPLMMAGNRKFRHKRRRSSSINSMISIGDHRLSSNNNKKLVQQTSTVSATTTTCLDYE